MSQLSTSENTSTRNIINTGNKTKAKEYWLVAKTHWAEYCRKPLLNIGFILSLAIATSTLLSILVLNHASQQQYHHANQQLKSPIAFYVVPKTGHNISIEDYSRLTALGFHQLSAMQFFRRKLDNGESLTFKAMDILPFVLMRPSELSTSAINIDANFASTLGLSGGSTVALSNGQELNVNSTNLPEWPNSALLDMTLAWQLFPDINGFSHLAASHMDDVDKERLAQILPEHLHIQETWSLEEREGFADALHLNLMALAVLGFIVSVFIAFQAANQAWQKRAELAAQLRLLGVNLRTIQMVMWIESLLLTTLATIIGIAIAAALVSALLPLLGLTLEQIYQLNISGHFQWQWSYSLWAFLISAVATSVALVNQFKEISTRHIALSARKRRSVLRLRYTAFFSLGLLAAYWLWPSESWHQLMLKNGFFLLSSVAILPNFLFYLLKALGALNRQFRLRFIFQDASAQVARRFLPIAAFYLALTASISAALMINSFESSFVTYLNQLLNSEMFIRYNSTQKEQVSEWVSEHDNIEEYVLFQKAIGRIDDHAVDIHALNSDRQRESLLLKNELASPTKRFESGRSFAQHTDTCFINEQLAYGQQLFLHQKVAFSQGGQQFACFVVGIYHDYGNQSYGIKINVNPDKKMPLSWQDVGYGVFFTTGGVLTKGEVIDALQLDDDQVFEPDEIKQLALAVFEQTFVLTQAIAFVLLTIACFGLFLSANNLELARKPDLHILSSLGFSRAELYRHMIWQWLMLAGGAVLMSWPVAMMLANVLVGQVLPASFGWSMPLTLDIAPFAMSSVIGLLILIPALGIPLYRLNIRASLS